MAGGGGGGGEKRRRRSSRKTEEKFLFNLKPTIIWELVLNPVRTQARVELDCPAVRQ